jgi:uncharacterized protein YcbK (DUF882 family)
LIDCLTFPALRSKTPLISTRRLFLGAALIALLGTGMTASAGSLRRPLRHSLGHRSAHLKVAHVKLPPLHMVPLLTAGTLPAPDEDVTLAGKEYRLNLYNLHTNESASVVYRVGDTYVPSAIDELNHFLRDHRTDEVSSYDPTEFDVLHNVLARLGRPDGEIDVVCGYRSPETNAYLRSLSADTGVAEHSQHILAKAIDIRVPGVPTAQLRNAALSLDAGGVGYYPVSQFVHVDVGPVREWSFAPRRVRGHGRAHSHLRKHRA